jgi:hypothetical protein
MTIIDFTEQREGRRRAEWERWVASQDGELAEIHRILDQLAPIFEQLLAQEKARGRRPRCEAPRCRNTFTTLHPLQGRTSTDAPALIRLCDGHRGAGRSGRIRVKADEADTLLW